MSEKKNSYVICPKCGHEAFKVHDPEKIKDMYPDKFIQVMLLRQYQCSNKECSHVWELSFMETLNAFKKMREDEGKGESDINKELKRHIRKEMRKYE